MRHIPNILSLIRLLMVGLFIYLFANGMYSGAFIVYIVAFFTDLLDGYIARRINWISDIGKVLDPLADKLLLLSALFCFYFVRWIPLFVLIIALFKELVMIIGGVIMFRKQIVVYADWFGKIAAGVFNAAVALTFVGVYWPAIGKIHIAAYCIALVMAFVALIHYYRKSVRPLLISERGKEKPKGKAR